MMNREGEESSDSFFMEKAMGLARRAYQEGEVPVGALVVLEGEVIGEGYNQVEKRQDVQAHAEMIAIKEASLAVGNWRLLGATLYSTLEPCAMCASAILLSRLKRVVYAASDKRLGAAGSFTNLFALSHPYHHIVPEKGPLAEESAHLMRAFFQERRRSKGVEDAE